MTFAGESNIGLLRERNEDNYGCIGRPGQINALAVVADGVGGHSGGEYASSVCVTTLLREWERLQAGHFKTADAIEGFLREYVAVANEEIRMRNQLERRPLPMGTTIVAAGFTPDEVVVLHAGDSRFYEVTVEGQCIQHTVDHTLLMQLINKNQPVQDEMERKRLSNVISRAIGMRAEVDFEVKRFHRAPRSRFLLCSDGLFRDCKNEEVGRMVAQAGNAREAIGRLVCAALIAGGRDNITGICCFP